MSQNQSTNSVIHARCCIAGGGPAGMMLGYLLARAGIETVVLEKHADFLRDFRGDTIHPSTLEVMHELGLLEEFLQRPHDQMRQVDGQVGDERLTMADFTHLPTRCKFIAFMPQWDFLDFLAGKGRSYSKFHLHMQSEVTALLQNNERITGVRVQTPQGELEIHADLVIGADGRSSIVREQAQLQVLNIGAPIDVLWMRISRQEGDPPQTLGRIDNGHIMVMLNRGDYWQCAYVIQKGGIDAIKASGLDAFRKEIAGLAPYLSERISELKTWDDIKLLTVTVDRLQQWHRPGLLCIGDAAHAMSPIGGVGINLAIQDAVATANVLTPAFLRGTPTQKDLAAVQERRTFPTRATQWMQVQIQNRVISRVLASAQRPTLPWQLKLLRAWPFLRRVPARFVGMGFRPEHVSKLLREARGGD
ncbi:FAD-dependent oxidoreductase [Stenotrophobium rhamnosiphilum]|nr:FAD-dependent oxidoreductase [Stenotrophobium rhamnosiphilum]